MDARSKSLTAVFSFFDPYTELTANKCPDKCDFYKGLKIETLSLKSPVKILKSNKLGI